MTAAAVDVLPAKEQRRTYCTLLGPVLGGLTRWREKSTVRSRSNVRCGFWFVARVPRR